jgi:hypothetical protein
MSLRPVQHVGDSGPARSACEVTEALSPGTGAGVQYREARRVHWRTWAKSAARSLCGDFLSMAALSRLLGTSESHGKKLCNPEDPAPLALGDVLAVADDPDGLRWAETLLEDALRAIREKAPASDTSFDRLQRLVARDAGAFADVLDKALADNRIDPGEARQLLQVARQNRRRWDDVIARLEALL